MKLTFTHYIDSDPETVVSRLNGAVAAGLDAAAQRAAAPRRDTRITPTDDGLHIDGGVDALAGTDLTVTGARRLTELRIEVPWEQVDAGTNKIWTANRFAGVLADRLAA
jgi:hypothetical protein